MMMGARVAIEEGNGWRFRSRSMGPWGPWRGLREIGSSSKDAAARLDPITNPEDTDGSGEEGTNGSDGNH